MSEGSFAELMKTGALAQLMEECRIEQEAILDQLREQEEGCLPGNPIGSAY